MESLYRELLYAGFDIRCFISDKVADGFYNYQLEDDYVDMYFCDDLDSSFHVHSMSITEATRQIANSGSKIQFCNGYDWRNLDAISEPPAYWNDAYYAHGHIQTD